MFLASSNEDERQGESNEGLEISAQLQYIKDEYQQQFEDMMVKYAGKWNGYLGQILMTKQLNKLLKRSVSKYKCRFRAGFDQQKLKRNNSDKILYENVSRPAVTEPTLLIVSPTEKASSLRFCVNYCKKNLVKVQISFLIPQMFKCNEIIGLTNFYLALDADRSYCKIELSEKLVDKTAFITLVELHWYTRMPVGFKNASKTF